MGDFIHCSIRMVMKSGLLLFVSLIGTSVGKYMLIQTEDYDDGSDFGRYTTKQPRGVDYGLELAPSVMKSLIKGYAKTLKDKSLAELLDMAHNLKPDLKIGELKDDILAMEKEVFPLIEAYPDKLENFRPAVKKAMGALWKNGKLEDEEILALGKAFDFEYAKKWMQVLQHAQVKTVLKNLEESDLLEKSFEYTPKGLRHYQEPARKLFKEILPLWVKDAEDIGLIHS